VHGSVAGFEANGGFLLGSDIEVNQQSLKALPTRDAVLPALMLLSIGTEGIAPVVDALPKRFTDSDRIKNFATQKSQKILASSYGNEQSLLQTLLGKKVNVVEIDTTDGLRMKLGNNDIVHLRPSGNAPELRCYAESNTIEQASQLVSKVLLNIQNIEIDE
jgi:phosphomannomutase